MERAPMLSKVVPLTADGGCLCGAIRYRISSVVEESGYCHCRTCQQQSGAPVVAWFALAPSGFCYLQGQPGIYRASDHAGREFCPQCGTYLVFREDDPCQTISVNTATLDNPMLSPPDFHIYCESRIGWFDVKDSLPRHKQGKP